ncbi:hypothetical protein COV13_03635 [Candidatus Woesearchaeota archaeon CG10_big_fil_rev_8_21_14_0_10_32_9]|nr:MAG: hypothetical protein COV13_03635 [Candidatus Woesearchaeota archaeon CG10_big_fil_rev_8_21_14_0_10_32_9]
MMRKKVYGEYQVPKCPFCNSVATIKNNQGIPVCPHHKKEQLENLKCSCGATLDLMQGKYGPFFKCINCNLINYKKGLELNGYPLKSINDL